MFQGCSVFDSLLLHVTHFRYLSRRRASLHGLDINLEQLFDHISFILSCILMVKTRLSSIESQPMKIVVVVVVVIGGVVGVVHVVVVVVQVIVVVIPVVDPRNIP